MTLVTFGDDSAEVARNLERTMLALLAELRLAPTAKRVRATVDGRTVVSTQRALLVWEPGRVVPQYAVPDVDVTAELRPDPVGRNRPPDWAAWPDGTRFVPPSPFRRHSADGLSFTVVTPNRALTAAAFRPADPDLAGYVVLDFHAFDAWFEEDEAIVAHPRDPYVRVDVRQGTRHVRVEVDGVALADSRRPVLLFEGRLPVRSYLPRADVRLDRLEPSPTRTLCAYKGQASHWRYDGRDIAWTYERPLSDAGQVTGLVCFYDERVDTWVDGFAVPRPPSPWGD